MDEKQKENRNVRKFIRISDAEIWNLIDRIMTVPEYEKSFNKVINHALKYGIVSLYEELFLKENGKSDKEIEGTQISSLVKKTKEDMITEDYLDELKTLMKEEILNLTIIKSIVGALYNIKENEIIGEPLSKDLMDDGRYGGTPKYLEAYELRMLKNLRGKK